jgi:hypothetical protein
VEGADARTPARGERVPTEEDPRFALRCVCGGMAGGVFPVLLVDGARVVRQRKLSGVRCSGCTRTYTFEWPDNEAST